MALTLDGCQGEAVARARLGLGPEYRVFRWELGCVDPANHFRLGAHEADCMVNMMFGILMPAGEPGQPDQWRHRIGICLPYEAIEK